MPIDILGLSIPLPGDSGDPSAADAKAALDKAYGQARLDLTNAQTDEARANAQNKVDQLANAKSQIDAAWAHVGIDQQNADTNSQNAGTNATKANNTAGYQQRSLDIRQSANDALSDYRQGMLNAKGDVNKINLAKVQYQHQMSMINAQLSQLKDEMTADTSLDVSADNQAVTQGDSRNTAALNATDNAAARISSPDMIKYGAFAGNPGGAAGAMSGLMQAGVAQSNATGGAPVDVQGLALQHKLEIANLVLNKGVSFQDAAKIVTAGGDPSATQGNGYTAGVGTNGALPGDPDPVQGYHSPGNFPSSDANGQTPDESRRYY